MKLGKLLNLLNDYGKSRQPMYFESFSEHDCTTLVDMMMEHAINKKKQDCPIVFLMIGTNRVRFDCLAPMAGSLIKGPDDDIIVYGTMERPVHALNLENTLEEIHRQYPDAYIIACDASLGSSQNIGKVFFSPDSLKPGLGVGKNLPASGDISICGVVGTPHTECLLNDEISEEGLNDMIIFIAETCLLFHRKFSSVYLYKN